MKNKNVFLTLLTICLIFISCSKERCLINGVWTLEKVTAEKSDPAFGRYTIEFKKDGSFLFMNTLSGTYEIKDGNIYVDGDIYGTDFSCSKHNLKYYDETILGDTYTYYYTR